MTTTDTHSLQAVGDTITVTYGTCKSSFINHANANTVYCRRNWVSSPLLSPDVGVWNAILILPDYDDRVTSSVV